MEMRFNWCGAGQFGHCGAGMGGQERARGGPEMLRWLRRRREAERLAQADAEALIRDHGGRAYAEAGWPQRDAILPDGRTCAGRTRAHWQRVAQIVAQMTASGSASTLQPGCSSAAPGTAENAIPNPILDGAGKVIREWSASARTVADALSLPPRTGDLPPSSPCAHRVEHGNSWASEAAKALAMTSAIMLIIGHRFSSSRRWAQARKRRRDHGGDCRRALHDDKARAFQMLHKPAG